MTTIDPITFAIIRHRLFRVVEEAVITLKHVSGSAITNEGHDLMVSLYTADGSLLMGGVGYLHHLTSAAEACKAIIRRFADNINEGDIFLLNDPYTAALHTSDVYLIAPAHYQGKLVAWSACFVHVSDIGAMNPGGFAPDAPDVFTEGFSSPGLKLLDRGVIRQDIWDTIINMVRFPGMVALDLKSMIACNNVARDRMLDLIAKYGEATFEDVARALIAQSEIRFRERLRELPDGRWQSRQYFDVRDQVYTVALTMTKTGDELVFDLSGSSPQSSYGVNCTKWASLGAIFAPLLPLVCHDLTWNDGVLRPVRVIVPEASIVNCRRPAPVSVATVAAVQSVNNAAGSAIAKLLAASDKYVTETTASWHANHFVFFLFSTDRHGEDAVGVLTESFGGAGGARSFADGIDVGGEIPNPISRMANVEATEASLPVRYLFRRRRRDSAGAGQYRGGAGGEFAVTAHGAPPGGIHCVASGKGVRSPQTDGLCGGYPGMANAYFQIKTAPDEQKVNAFPQKLEAIGGERHIVSWGPFTLADNDILYICWNGGGGFGDPLNRDPQKVAADVARGLVSSEAAADLYGVVFNGGELDPYGTLAVRASRRSPVHERRDAVPRGERYSETLRIVAGIICCNRCGEAIATEPWKPKANLRQRPLAELPGATSSTDAQFILREFSCPNCRTLLDTEIARRGDAFLEDTVSGCNAKDNSHTKHRREL